MPEKNLEKQRRASADPDRPGERCNAPAGSWLPVVDHGRCEAKRDCTEVCPHDVFEVRRIDPEDFARLGLLAKIRVTAHRRQTAYAVDADRCRACGMCVVACPEGAIQLAAALTGRPDGQPEGREGRADPAASLMGKVLLTSSEPDAAQPLTDQTSSAREAEDLLKVPRDRGRCQRSVEDQSVSAGGRRRPLGHPAAFISSRPIRYWPQREPPVPPRRRRDRATSSTPTLNSGTLRRRAAGSVGDCSTVSFALLPSTRASASASAARSSGRRTVMFFVMVS